MELRFILILNGFSSLKTRVFIKVSLWVLSISLWLILKLAIIKWLRLWHSALLRLWTHGSPYYCTFLKSWIILLIFRRLLRIIRNWLSLIALRTIISIMCFLKWLLKIIFISGLRDIKIWCSRFKINFIVKINPFLFPLFHI